MAQGFGALADISKNAAKLIAHNAFHSVETAYLRNSRRQVLSALRFHYFMTFFAL